MPTRANFGKKNAFGAQTVEMPPRALGRPKVSASLPSVEKARWPILTLTFTAFLACVFWFEQRYRVDPMPGPALSFRDCVALGGVSRYLALHDHQWWRILTAPFLHGGVVHLVGNATALVLGGYFIEKLLGRAWLACLFFMGGVASSIGSMTYTGETRVAVGASGAIVCLLTVLFALSFHYNAGKSANRMRRRAIGIVIPALLPNAADSLVKIDYGAHFGGILAGIAFGFLILILWSEEEQSPPWQGVAAGVAAIAAIVSLIAAWQVVLHYPAYAAENATLVPSARLKVEPQALADASADFVERYPHDPIAHLLRSAILLDKHDSGDAEDEARKGLSEQELLSTEFPPEIRDQLNMVLAMALASEGRKDEAKAMSGQVCGLEPSNRSLKAELETLAREGVCN